MPNQLAGLPFVFLTKAFGGTKSRWRPPQALRGATGWGFRHEESSARPWGCPGGWAVRQPQEHPTLSTAGPGEEGGQELPTLGLEQPQACSHLTAMGYMRWGGGSSLGTGQGFHPVSCCGRMVQPWLCAQLLLMPVGAWYWFPGHRVGPLGPGQTPFRINGCKHQITAKPRLPPVVQISLASLQQGPTQRPRGLAVPDGFLGCLVRPKHEGQEQHCAEASDQFYNW